MRLVLKDNDVLRFRSDMEEVMKRFGRLIVTLFIALLFVSVANLAARAQSVPFTATAQINGQVTVPMQAPMTSTVYYRPSGVKQLQSGVDNLGDRMTDLENGQQQIVDEMFKLRGSNASAIADLERRFNRSDWLLWLVVLATLLVLIAWLFGRRGDVTNNNYYGRNDASDRGPQGLEFSLGRELEEGDEIIFRRHHPHTSHTEKNIIGGKAEIDVRFGEIVEPEREDKDKGKTIPVEEAGK